ncbi:hypothetical protein MDAP_000619 [Mitosporidium daphniae]
MSSFSLLIINKAGGLIFSFDFPTESGSLASSNHLMVLASTFQSIHAISCLLVPDSKCTPVSLGPFVGFGITTINGREFNLHCRQTVTGLKFLLISHSEEPIDDLRLELFFNRLYSSYANCILKNPFYTLDMPIKCQAFNSSILKIASESLSERKPTSL